MILNIKIIRCTSVASGDYKLNTLDINKVLYIEKLDINYKSVFIAY